MAIPGFGGYAAADRILCISEQHGKARHCVCGSQDFRVILHLKARRTSSKGYIWDRMAKGNSGTACGQSNAGYHEGALSSFSRLSGLLVSGSTGQAPARYQQVHMRV